MNPPETPRIRVGHAEREWAVTELGEHLSQGRLDPDEYADRTTAAYAARTSDELEALFVDLPRPAPAAAPVAYPSPYPAVRADAPYGVDPRSGVPYSDRSKVVAGVLQLVLPFGVGRFYSGHHGIAVAQLLLSIFLIGAIWAFIDGIVLLAGRPTDPYGRPLRP
ncbi:DUF1707 domain-containing protein [Pseudonocardia abyssalis]|uniref:DUF1707 domain-containing protein n=1 Tax=Pseudonocardia abyssalis TaxID=2792008 RepID=UPI001CF67430|nr:DUF1707 domain-containing protein [Pseudonocardia abyssalis]